MPAGVTWQPYFHSNSILIQTMDLVGMARPAVEPTLWEYQDNMNGTNDTGIDTCILFVRVPSRRASWTIFRVISPLCAVFSTTSWSLLRYFIKVQLIYGQYWYFFAPYFAVVKNKCSIRLIKTNIYPASLLEWGHVGDIESTPSTFHNLFTNLHIPHSDQCQSILLIVLPSADSRLSLSLTYAEFFLHFCLSALCLSRKF